MSAGLSEGGALAVRAVGDQDHQRLQDSPRQGPVYPTHVLHHHEPAEPGQRGLCPRSGRLRPRARLRPHKGERPPRAGVSIATGHPEAFASASRLSCCNENNLNRLLTKKKIYFYSRCQGFIYPSKLDKFVERHLNDIQKYLQHTF